LRLERLYRRIDQTLDLPGGCRVRSALTVAADEMESVVARQQRELHQLFHGIDLLARAGAVAGSCGGGEVAAGVTESVRPMFELTPSRPR
jgi:hypothetical protein